MADNGMVKQGARWVALGALFLIPLTPLIVANSFFFPFITGKAFYFRILVEVALAGWAVLAVMDRAYRPRFSWLGVILIAFVAWMGIADALAVNATKAFWSNFERMEGWVFLAHLAAFFFTASAVLRVERKWRAWFLTSLSVSVVICLYALMQLGGSLQIHQGSTRIDATLGNSAYLAIYLLFSACVAVWLALTEEQTWLKWFLLGLAGLQIILIFFTETRGTIIGLVLGIVAAALLTSITAGERPRRYAVGVLIAVMVVSGGFYLIRDSALVQGNRILERIASISLADGQTRFTLWGMALQGVAERPVVGWGQEGFNYIFNAYYEPSLYAQEQWFDRAHNAFIDWLTAGGIPAFLLYSALFAAALFLLWRSPDLSRPERIALTAALVGYAVHNAFVFDNLSSYIYFFAVLALIDSQVARPITRFEAVPVLDEAGATTYALPIAGVALVALIWVVNVPGMRVASGLIDTLSSNQGTPSEVIGRFEKLLNGPAFARQEVREQVVNYAATAVRSESLNQDDKQTIVSYAVQETQKQIAAYPRDARTHMQLVAVYHAAGALPQAQEAVQRALALSPRKEQMWIESGAIAWEAGDMRRAYEAFAKAYELGPQFPELATYLAIGHIGLGELNAADAVLLKAYGTTTVDSEVLAIAYYRAQAWSRLIALSQLRAAKPGATAQQWFALAAAHYTAGNRARAIEVLRQTSVRFPESAASVAAAIAQIEAGK